MQGHGAAPLSYGAVGPTINLDSSKEETYVALEKPLSEDKELESEVDAHISLEDVEHPATTPRTPRSWRRWFFW